MESSFGQIAELLEQGKRLVLARIITLVGSAPRNLGAKCIIQEDGSFFGTIGGGLLEHQVLERAKTVFKDGTASIYHFQLTGDDVSTTDMLCGGILDVYLEPLFPENQETTAVFKAAEEVIKNGQRATLLTRVSEKTHALDSGNKMLVSTAGQVQGEIAGLAETSSKLVNASKPQLMQIPKHEFEVFVETVEHDPVLLLFGAGHVSTFIAPLAKMVGFQIVVIDDRAEFANRKRFPSADKIVVLPFEQVFEKIEVTPTAYITIITRGHTFDKIVLQSALQTEPAYIGMIGSSRKRKAIYQALLEAGISQEKLDQVSSPIGLAIEAETPEEIAVSIVAELIKTRAGKIRETTVD